MSKGYPDYEGDKSGLYLKPEWAAKEGIDKTLFAVDLTLAYGESVTALYIVPAGKTFRISGISCSTWAGAAADADNEQHCIAEIQDFTTGTYVFSQGGNGGVGHEFSVPRVIPAGHTVYCTCWNFANHSCRGVVTAWGYEV